MYIYFVRLAGTVKLFLVKKKSRARYILDVKKEKELISTPSSLNVKNIFFASQLVTPFCIVLCFVYNILNHLHILLHNFSFTSDDKI